MPFLRRPHHYEVDGSPAPTDGYAAALPSTVANAWLALLLGLVLFHPATHCGNANVHRLTDVRDAEALFCDHSNDLKLEARVKIAALPGHVNSFEGELSTYRGVRRH